MLSVGTVTTSDRKSFETCHCAFFNFRVDVYLKVGPSSAVVSLLVVVVVVVVDFFGATDDVSTKCPSASLIMLGAMTATGVSDFRLNITEQEDAYLMRR